ncbi:alpha/beta hydrolase family protein [Angustibacter luteus]|uniref:Alpha/beta hydrolase family protein n=1 Tax=Angustibacter luteus TaxID=658456 RepID=A0ABW1JCZ2_9ACTN
MSEAMAGRAWIGVADGGVVLARPSASGADELLVDRPAGFRYRSPEPAVWRDGVPVLDGVVLRPVSAHPSRMAGLSGWYGDDDRQVLLTQVPEPYFGEPMVLLAEGDRVTRAYPLGENAFLTEDAVFLEVADDQLHLTGPSAAATLARTSRWHERAVGFEVAGATYAGTVVLPAGPGPHPAAVVLHGAAGGQRDFCRIQSWALLRAGVGVLNYDKAGHGDSGGPPDPSIYDQADAAEAAMQVLSDQPDVDPARIGLAGFSNGMWSVPMVAARRPAAFVVGAGSPGVSMAESEVHRRTKVLRDVGVSEPTLVAVAQAWRSLFAIVAGGPTDELTGRLGAALDDVAAAPDLDRYEVPGYVAQNPMLSPIPPLVPVDELVPMLAGERDPQLAYDPADDYARIGCPVFLQYGEVDTSVPVDVSIARITEAVRSAGQSLTVRVYPELEHMLNVVSTRVVGLTAEDAMYQYHDFTFGAGTWADLTIWLSENVFREVSG